MKEDCVCHQEGLNGLLKKSMERENVCRIFSDRIYEILDVDSEISGHGLLSQNLLLSALKIFSRNSGMNPSGIICRCNVANHSIQMVSDKIT